MALQGDLGRGLADTEEVMGDKENKELNRFSFQDISEEISRSTQ